MRIESELVERTYQVVRSVFLLTWPKPLLETHPQVLVDIDHFPHAFVQSPRISLFHQSARGLVADADEYVIRLEDCAIGELYFLDRILKSLRTVPLCCRGGA